MYGIGKVKPIPFDVRIMSCQISVGSCILNLNIPTLMATLHNKRYLAFFGHLSLMASLIYIWTIYMQNRLSTGLRIFKYKALRMFWKEDRKIKPNDFTVLTKCNTQQRSQRSLGYGCEEFILSFVSVFFFLLRRIRVPRLPVFSTCQFDSSSGRACSD